MPNVAGGSPLFSIVPCLRKGVEHQAADGHWENTKHWTPNPTDDVNIEISAEFVMHLANLIAYLSV